MLVDIGQGLAAFHDSIVVVGGWVPDLLAPDAEPRHIGSIDVDLALDVEKLNDGRYAELLKLLLDSGRYQMGDKAFQLVTHVPLDHGEPSVRVEVEFLAPSEVRMQKTIRSWSMISGFPACAAAFQAPVDIEIVGQMTSGAENRVHLRVASLADFMIMKAHAIGGRDKPKDVYDLCYCLDGYPGGIATLGEVWRQRRGDPLIGQAVQILREKFETVNHYGPGS